MSKYGLYLLLTVANMAMLLFLCGFVLTQLGLAWLAALLYGWASKLLLLVFAALLLLAVFALINAIWRQLADFFDGELRAKRRLLALSLRRQDSEILQTERSRQLRYFQQFKRQRLIAADDKKQLHALFAAIQNELKHHKASTSPLAYNQLKKSLQQAFKRADAEAMIAIRRQFPCQ